MTKDARPLLSVIARNVSFTDVVVAKCKIYCCFIFVFNLGIKSNRIIHHDFFDAKTEDNYKATIDFAFCSVLYTFTVERWARRGLTGFLNLFHLCGARDMLTNGIRIEDDNCAI